MDFTRDTGLEIQLSFLVNLAFTCCRTLLGLLLFASAVAPFCEAGVLAILDGVELVGGGGEGLPLAAADNADGERVFRRDSAMESDTACDLGDVVFGGGGGGGGEGGVVREDDGGERGALSLADAEL
ncbi:hypothetical protein ACHAXH_009095 [Discostella pseudostelligera]